MNWFDKLQRRESEREYKKICKRIKKANRKGKTTLNDIWIQHSETKKRLVADGFDLFDGDAAIAPFITWENRVPGQPGHDYTDMAIV